jgi:MoaD family protein
MTALRIPPVLRAATGGEKRLSIEGATVREVINRLVAEYPGTEAQLRTPDGELNTFVNVFVNGTDVRHLQALDTPVTDRDEVVLLPAMAGG